MSQQTSTAPVAPRWASGLIVFSGSMLVVTGVLQLFIGVSALVHDAIYDGAPRYLFAFDLTTWGWIQMLAGIAAIGAGYGALRGLTWARILGIVVAGISIIIEFAYIPYFPIWSVVVVALDVAIIWGLAMHQPTTA
jgi:hypothetical protein